MKSDIKVLLKFLRDYSDVFHQSEMFLIGEKEDREMHEKIEEIQNKYNIKL